MLQSIEIYYLFKNKKPHEEEREPRPRGTKCRSFCLFFDTVSEKPLECDEVSFPADKGFPLSLRQTIPALPLSWWLRHIQPLPCMTRKTLVDIARTTGSSSSVS